MKMPKITADLYQYIQAHNPPAHPILAELAELTQKRPDANMQISADQGSFLHLLARLIQAKRIVEVGCFTGYSAICMGSALPTDGKLITMDINPETAKIANSFFDRAGLSDRIELRQGEAIHSLQRLLEEFGPNSFDLAFIDADKENYTAYYEACLQLIRPYGLIAVDNVLWGGSVLDSQDQSTATVAIRQFNELLRQDHRVSRSMLTIADGLFLAVKLDQQ